MVIPPWYELPPRGYGGLEMICAALVDGLVDRGHDVTVYGAGERHGTKARFVSTAPTLQYPRLGESMPDVLHAARANELIQAGDFDVVHDHTTPGALTASRLTTPTVITVHGAVDGELGDYYAAAPDAVNLVAISHAQRAVRPDLNWIATVHNGVSVPDGPLTVRRPGAAVMWLARFNPDKGPDLAITACRAAGLPLVLAGKCNEPAEERYFAKTVAPMLDDSVEVLINADRPTILAKLREARCLIMPIRWEEPFGMVMIEAMAEGVPVVALRRGAVAEVVDDGVTGFVCNRPEDLPAALLRVDQLAPADCVMRVRNRFSTGFMARRYEHVYRTVVARHFTVPAAASTPTDIVDTSRHLRTGMARLVSPATVRPGAGTNARPGNTGPRPVGGNGHQPAAR
jgi:glycosyltransferase involved in cell wall biosynthesis